MSLLPALFDDDSGRQLPVSRQVREAVRLQEQAELELFNYQLERRVMAEYDRADTHALFDATQAAYDAEVGLLDHGLTRAGQSAAKAALIARHVERMAAINDRRITRRFGG